MYGRLEGKIVMHTGHKIYQLTSLFKVSFEANLGICAFIWTEQEKITAGT